MADEYQIHLNFLPVAGELPTFTVHRKLRTSDQEARPSPDIMSYRLPRVTGEDRWPSYWIAIDAVKEYEPFAVTPLLNPHLTCRVLFWALSVATRRVLKPDEFHIPQNSFIEEISFIQRVHSEGDEQLVVQPYFLRASRQYGYLMDFHFRLRKDVVFSRKVQQLSLSLDKSFRRNLNYYIDRDSKVRTFVRERKNVLGSLHLPGTTGGIALAEDYAALSADWLKPKIYVFCGNRESRGQFPGLRDHGPLRPLEAEPRLLFIFREQDRQAARTLAQGLRAREHFSFPGFNKLFKCEIEIDDNPIVLSDLHRHAMENALAQVQERRKSVPNIFPILVIPAETDTYLIHKSLFSEVGIPTQVCTLRILRDENALKWAISNLALQIFCKAGGYPWKVRPSAAERTLIIGISQSHKLKVDRGKTSIEKYFAFSVMTDNSGLFQKIQVLGESSDESDYLRQLRDSLQEMLQQNAQEYSRVVIHTSFKLKHREIDAIQHTVQDIVNGGAAAGCCFAVVKVNHKTRFFGVNRGVNCLVPYEATRVKLGPGEYLLWFEGIFPNQPTVTKAFPGPTHVHMLRVSDQNAIPEDVLLQDLVNLSGANWRGFNAKSAPVSTFYCHLVADMMHDFHERGLPLPSVENIKPWFL